MIKEKKVSIKISPKTINYYKNKGYNCKVRFTTDIKIEDLSHGSKIKITAICDSCGLEKNKSYNEYYRFTKKNTENYYCTKCKYLKTKETNLRKYGTKCTLHNSSIKEKVKNTNLEKYGTEYASQSDIIKEKVKNTNLEKHGVDNIFKSEYFKKKAIKSNLDKYGTEYASQSDIIKEKVKNTNLEKHGVDNIFKSKEFKDNIKNNNILHLKNYYNFNNNELLSNEFNILNKDIEYRCIDCNEIFIINKQLLNIRRNRNEIICTKCNTISNKTSHKEKDVVDFIEKLQINKHSIENDRSVLDGKELDIYIPELNLSIEFNGLYWHSELYKEKEYHLNKTIECQNKGIQLLHIFEDDWNYKQDIIKSIIRNKLGKIGNKIYARKCVIKEVKSNVARQFLDSNHIQGFSRSKYKLGLYYNNELVSLMTFGYRKTNSKKEFELIRFCNKLDTNVVGASSRLFKHFINNYKDKIEENYILSYADISLFNGKMYETLGFNEIHLTKPNYFWVVNGVREHRWKYNKQNLIKEGYSKDKTEVEIMHGRGYYRIYGCGQKRYEYKI